MTGNERARRIHADDDAWRLASLRILNDDVFPHMDRPEVIWDDRRRVHGYRAFAPCHIDVGGRSLTVSIGDDKPIVWNCFTCKPQFGNDEAQRITRNALIGAGVPAAALIWSAGEATWFAEKCEKAIKDGISGPRFKLWVTAWLESFDELPGGAELERLAAKAGCSRAEAYGARRAASKDYRYLPHSEKPCQAAQVRAAS